MPDTLAFETTPLYQMIEKAADTWANQTTRMFWWHPPTIGLVYTVAVVFSAPKVMRLMTLKPPKSAN